jgi:hypothetical protein
LFSIKKGKTEMHSTAKTQKWLLWSSLLLSQPYTVAYVYLLNFWPPVSPTLSPEQVVALYAGHNIEFRAGAALMMLSGAFYLLFTVVLAAQLARCETGFRLWSKLTLTGGTLATCSLVFPPFMWAVAAFTVERDAGLTMILHEIGWLSFVATPTFFVLQMIAIGVIAFSGDQSPRPLFPRWLGYVSLWTALGSVFGLAALVFKTGPFAWNGALAFYLPLIVFAIWFVSLYISLFKAISR